MKLFIGILVCVVISVLTSFFFPGYNPDKDVVMTLYTIAGIMFSIGMSLCITSNTSGVKNLIIKRAIRSGMKRVRTKFIVCFSIVSGFYIIKDFKLFNQLSINNSNFHFDYKYDHLVIFLAAYSIIYMVSNFIAIQNLNLQIEDTINSEYSDEH